MKTRKELEDRIHGIRSRIVEFLKVNEGNYYTEDEINKELELKCAGMQLNNLRATQDSRYIETIETEEIQKGFIFTKITVSKETKKVRSITVPKPKSENEIKASIFTDSCDTEEYYGWDISVGD